MGGIWGYAGSGQVVGCFESFYRCLRRRFRYGQVDGTVWHATNGLAQGCPASPDLLNILLEPFHRWAGMAGHGVEVTPTCRVASVSFADDIALVAHSQQDLETLIASYLQWCSLLGVRVTKVQAWSSCNGIHTLSVPALDVPVITGATFRFVGVVLGATEKSATAAHFTPRLQKALVTTRRLRLLELPASICSLLWRVAVLPQALYGCEVRDITPVSLVPLSRAGQAAIQAHSPLHLTNWRASEILTGPPLGDTAVCEPILEVRLRQLRWVQLISNLPTLVGVVHRAAGWNGLFWKEPSAALAAALSSLGWRYAMLPCTVLASGLS